MTQPYASRAIPLEGMYNLRDIGGLPTADGRTTRWRTILRSDSPHRLSEAGVQALLAEGLRSVLDLRYPHDLQAEPDPFAACATVDYHHTPMYLKLGGDGDFTSLAEMFCRILDHHGDSLVGQLRLLATPGKLPALIHCSSGKDRTGMLVAVALKLAGVSDDDVVADFALSADNLRPDHRLQAERLTLRGWSPQKIAWFLESPPEAMTGALAHLQQAHSGVAAYLTARGFGPADQAALRSLLVE